VALARRVGKHLIVYDELTSRRLSRFGHEPSKPEKVVRRALHLAGLRFRIHNRDLPGSPDVANRRARWAVFVHGCYWHHHPGCRRATIPARNRAFWLEKFRANRRRDARVVRELEAAGYEVAVVWECEAADQRMLRSRLSRLIRVACHRARDR